MAKGDYTSNSTITAYRGKMREQSLTKIVVAANEKRNRAELLDMVEELFSVDGGITRENLRAFLHIIIKATANPEDDIVTLTNTTTSAEIPTSDPGVAGKLWTRSGALHISAG